MNRRDSLTYRRHSLIEEHWERERQRARFHQQRGNKEDHQRERLKVRERRRNYNEESCKAERNRGRRKVYLHDAFTPKCLNGQTISLNHGQRRQNYKMTMVSFPFAFLFLLFMIHCLAICKTEKGLTDSATCLFPEFCCHFRHAYPTSQRLH